MDMGFRKLEMGFGNICTRKLPGLAFVEVNFSNGSASEIAVHNLLEKVVGDELFICGVKSEPRWQM